MAGLPSLSWKFPAVLGVAEGASGEPIWDLASRYLRSQREIRPKAASRPHLLGVTDNPGLS